MNEKYTDLKNELPSISEAVKMFPDSLQSKVFDLLVSQFLGKVPPTGDDNKGGGRPNTEVGSLAGIANLSDSGNFTLTVRDVKADSQFDAQKRLIYIIIRAYTQLKGEPSVSRKTIINPILAKWRVYDGNARKVLANDKGILREDDMYSLDVHATSEADTFISEASDPNVTGTWKPSESSKRKRGKKEKTDEEKESKDD